VHNEITADEQEELAGYSEYLLDGTHKMARIIDDFRAFARQDEKIKEPTSVNTAITKAITLLENQLKLAAIEVELKILEEDQQFLGDSVKLEQVLVNLLTNARDALEGVAKKKIEVSAEIKGKNIEIRVSDNGPGIKEDLLTKILDPFFTTKEVGRGTGLGLSVSHGIIESFEGNLTVANNKNGAGCAFTISLPLL